MLCTATTLLWGSRHTTVKALSTISVSSKTRLFSGMRAMAAARSVRVSEWGGPEVLKIESIPIPAPGVGQVCVCRCC